MEEIKNKQDYYINKNRKIVDWCIGFFGLISSYLLLWGAAWIIYPLNNFAGSLLNTSLSIVQWIPVIGLIWFGVAKKRNFIVRGVIVAFLVPVVAVALMWGMCLLGGFKWN